MSPFVARPLIDRIRERVVIPDDDGCWLWQGSLRTGYGRISVGDYEAGTQRLRMAHRVIYEMFVGPIPEGLQLDHLCRVRNCVNPAHLEPVTVRENLMRGTGPSAIAARQTHCIHGHEFTPENTRINLSGARACRACCRRWSAEQRARQRRVAIYEGTEKVAD